MNIKSKAVTVPCITELFTFEGAVCSEYLMCLYEMFHSDCLVPKTMTV